MMPLKIATVVGARPQFIKAAPVSQSLRERHTEVLIHTGQHYDDNMSAVFFRELGLPEPDYHLGVGSGPHGAQTGKMLAALEATFLAERPDWVLIYGDTNSTLAGALAAAKLRLPVAHVEAGLRSFNRAMPEEVNRVIADQIATLLLCPSETAVRNLAREGITRGVKVVGDVMADSLFLAVDRARRESAILERLGLAAGGYVLATLHRAENTDDVGRLGAILTALGELEGPVVFPIHPRTRRAVQAAGLTPLLARLRVIEPLGYLDMVRALQAARLALTDSGGLQKEAYWLRVPCLTLRDETEWVETVEAGWNKLVGAAANRIVAGARAFRPPEVHPVLYGDGQAAAQIVAALIAP